MTPTPTALLVTHLAIDLILLSSCYMLAKKHRQDYNRPHLAMMGISLALIVVMFWTILTMI